VADGTDNFPTRYLVNDACVLLGIPQCVWVDLQVRRTGERVCDQAGPCYRLPLSRARRRRAWFPAVRRVVCLGSYRGWSE